MCALCDSVMLLFCNMFTIKSKSVRPFTDFKCPALSRRKRGLSDDWGKNQSDLVSQANWLKLDRLGRLHVLLSYYYGIDCHCH